MFQWLRDHPEVLTWLGAASVVTFVAGLFLVPWLVVRLPADRFLVDPRATPAGPRRHVALRVLFHVAHNLLGGVLVLAGIAMLVLPGQGILTILLGLSLLDLPGRQRLELALVSRPRSSPQ